jgi:hypothetical protein
VLLGYASASTAPLNLQVGLFGDAVAREREKEGAKFVRYFGPLLNALRGLGGSAKADEAVDRVAEDLKLSDDVLNEVLHVRDFRGAMAGRADKGIIVTTGTFTAEARREATRDGAPPIELLDGEKLLDMLEKLELGLKPVTTFEVEHAFFKEFEA